MPPPKQTPQQEEDDSISLTITILLLMLAFMVFFFMLVPIFLGLWTGVGVMAAIGCVLVLAGVYVFRSSRKRLERIREQRAAKVKCRYCGSPNEQTALRCSSCGATL